MSNKVVICGVDTSSLPHLSSCEMLELIEKVKCDPDVYREQFVFANMRLVLSLVQRFCLKKELVDDVFQVGVIGLLKAVDNFDTSVGVKFSTYAVPMIIGEIRRFLRDGSALKVTRALRDIAYRAMQSRENFSRAGIEPTIEIIAKDIEASPAEIKDALDAIADPVSLYDFAYSDGTDGIELIDQIRDPKNSEEIWIENNALERAMKELDERERTILLLRYYEGKTQMEISNEIGISQAQVSRLEKDALAFMRSEM